MLVFVPVLLFCLLEKKSGFKTFKKNNALDVKNVKIRLQKKKSKFWRNNHF
jgi:hypothetical protein